MEDHELLVSLIGFLLTSTGATAIEALYYELKMHTGHNAPAVFYKKLNILKFTVRLDKLIIVIYRLGLFLWLAGMFGGFDAESFMKAFGVGLMFIQLHEAAYNFTRYKLGSERYKEWWTYLSPGDTSLWSMNYVTRMALFIPSVLFVIVGVLLDIF